jgi:hypothetical protein
MQPQSRPGGFDMGRLTMGQKLLGITALILLISLFLPWRSIGLEFLGANFGNISGFSASAFSYLVILGILGVLVLEGLMVGGVLTGNFNGALISAIVGGVTALLAIIMFLTVLSGVTWGAFVGLLAALAMGYAAYVRFQESKTTALPPGAPPSAPPPTAP